MVYINLSLIFLRLSLLWSRLASNSYLHLPTARITGVSYHPYTAVFYLSGKKKRQNNTKQNLGRGFWGLNPEFHIREAHTALCYFRRTDLSYNCISYRSPLCSHCQYANPNHPLLSFLATTLDRLLLSDDPPPPDKSRLCSS